MRKFLSLFLAVGVLAVIYSCGDQVDTDNIDVSSIAPRIESFSPEDGASPLKGDTFNISVSFADGELSPLSSATITLWDGDNLDDPSLTQVQSITRNISGTEAEIVWDAAEFESYNLDTAAYIVTISVSDSEGATTESNFSFEVIGQLYTANNTEMYVAGSFNGWAATEEALEGFELELVADNTWEITEVPFNGGGWKFKNTVDWSDQDWGDSDCDGVMENTTGGGPNTECGFDGLVNITFNDETLEYTVELLTPPASNIDGLFLVGNFNNFVGNSEYQFQIDTNNTWVLEEVFLQPGDVFLFSEAETLTQDIWGDDEGDGIADAFGSSITIGDDMQEGFYKITFVDITREYYVDFVKGLFPENLYLVGGSTAADWEPTAATQFEQVSEGYFRTYQYITVDGGGFKFLPTNVDYTDDYGTDGDGNIVQEGESNVTVDADGFYRIDVDFNTGTISVVESNWGIIGNSTNPNDDDGDGTPDGWQADTDMSLVTTDRGETRWEITMDLAVGEIKFRENDDWGINYGGSDGNLEFNAGNIAIGTAGNYTVTIDLDSDAGYSYTLTQNP